MKNNIQVLWRNLIVNSNRMVRPFLNPRKFDTTFPNPPQAFQASFTLPTSPQAFQALLEKDNFAQLDFSKQPLPLSFLNILANILLTHKNLINLNLHDNYLGLAEVDIIELFIKALERNKTLKHLDLSGNYLEDHSIGALARALKANNSLTYLSLGQHFFSHEAVKILADALKVNSGLTHLDFSDAPFSKADLSILIDALSYNKTLRSLNLSHCLTTNCAAHIINLLECVTNLVEINLTGNGIGEENERYIQKLLEKNLQANTPSASSSPNAFLPINLLRAARSELNRK